ncbi:MAG: hypothetical protein RL301_170 [Actinomycetota bacterium]
MISVNSSPIILALDTNDLATAKSWVNATRASIDIYKVGLEFFLKFGRTGLAEIQGESGAEIFLDLKLHDIPNTVSSAVKSVSDLAPRFLTVHASGGAAMIAAAVAASPEISITAVTILTSLNEADLIDIGFKPGTNERAAQLAKLATDNGARAIVCSPLEIESVRKVIPNNVSIITPGIRPETNSLSDDQKRTMTPSAAIAAGANYLVIGRPITEQWKNGASAMSERAAQIRAEIK